MGKKYISPDASGTNSELEGIKQENIRLARLLELATAKLQSQANASAKKNNYSSKSGRNRKGALAPTPDKTSSSDALAFQRTTELALYASMVNSSYDAVVSYNTGDLITSWSKGAENLFGFRAEEMLGKSISLLKNPGQANEVHQNAEHRIGEGLDLHSESERTRKDGTVVPVSLVQSPMKDFTGKVIGTSNIFNDISRRRKAEKKVKLKMKELEQYKYVLEESTILDISSEDTKITYLNDNFCHISQYTHDELVGSDHRILNSKYHSSEFMKELHNTISSGKTWRGNLKNMARDGTFFWVATTIVPVRDVSDNHYNYIAVRTDITEQKMAEEELIAQEKLFHLLVEQNEDIISMFDENGTLVYASESLRKITGYSFEERLQIAEKVHPEDRKLLREAQLAIKKNPGIPKTIEYRLKHKLGYYIWVRATHINLMDDPNVRGVVVNIRDISESRLAEQAHAKCRRLYAFISALNDNIIRVDDERALFKLACDIAVEVGEYKMAWIGMIDPKTNHLVPLVSCGNETEIIPPSSTPENNGLHTSSTSDADANPSKKINVFNDIRKSGLDQEFINFGVEGGYRSGIDLPIRKFGKVIGFYSFYSAEKDFFDEEEVTFLEKATELISVTLENIENEESRKQTECKLEEQEALFRTMIEKSVDMITLTSEAGKLTYASPAVSQTLGYTEAELLADVPPNFLHPDDIDQLNKDLAKIIKIEGGSFHSMHRMLHKDGTCFWCEGTITNMLLDPCVKALVSNFRDVSERKLVESKLKASEETFKLLFEKSADATLLLQDEGFTMYNKASLKILGYKDDLKIINKFPWELSPPKQPDGRSSIRKAKSLLKKTVSRGFHHFEWTMLKADGTELPVEVMLTSFLINGKQSYFTRWRDLTEWKSGEKLLKGLTNRLLLATESAKLGIWDWDLVNNTLAWDKGMYSLYDISPDKFHSLYESWFDRIHPDDRNMVQENMQRALDGDESYEPYFRIVWDDKSVHHIKASGYIERDKSGKAIRMIGANTDITELKESGEKLRQSEAFSSGVLRSLSSHIAVINSSGVIIAVNEAWKRFGKLKGKSVLKRTEVGSNYFEDCKLMIEKGDITSAQALKGMLDVMNGETELFNLEYPCGTDDDEYWFGMRVMKFDSQDPMIVVAHENITSGKNAEKERDLTLIELERRVEERTNTIANKNKDITDSINYAKRIQLGLLSSQSKLTEVFTKSFVISKPRDIVSGDFFWCHQSQGRKFIVLADCTGHGVPGALMSIIGNNLLEQIIANEHVEHPSEILELLDERLADTLKGNSDDIKDGMDISLCLIDENFKEMYYACAFQPVFVTNKKGDLRQLPVSRFSIGAEFYGGTKIFETERIPFVPGTRIYLSSDGFYSQFGGENDKKLMKSGFRKMLTAMQKIPFYQQQDWLSANLSSWTGDKEQVDDILVVGIEL